MSDEDAHGAVIVLTGPPGAGKTTVAANVARRYPRAVHLHTDDFWHAIVAGAIPPYEPESDAQNQTVLTVIAGAAFGYAAGGFVTVVDGIIGPWMLDHVRARMSDVTAIPVHYVVLRPDLDATLARAQNRTAPGALVDRTPIVALWEQFADLGPLEQHAVDTTDDDTARTCDRVVEAIASQHYRLR